MDLEILKGSRQLFQVKPPNTNAYSVFAKDSKRKVVLLNITIVNTTASSALYSLFLDKNGTTYDTTTALAYNVAVAANTVSLVEYNLGLPIDFQSDGNFAVQVGTANAFTITGNGIEL